MPPHPAAPVLYTCRAGFFPVIIGEFGQNSHRAPSISTAVYESSPPQQRKKTISTPGICSSASKSVLTRRRKHPQASVPIPAPRNSLLIHLLLVLDFPPPPRSIPNPNPTLRNINRKQYIPMVRSRRAIFHYSEILI